MNFSEALICMKSGRHVAREHWPESSYLYVRYYRDEPPLLAHKTESTDSPASLGPRDITADDWRILRDPDLSDGEPFDVAGVIYKAQEIDARKRTEASGDSLLDHKLADQLFEIQHQDRLHKMRRDAEKVRFAGRDPLKADGSVAAQRAASEALAAAKTPAVEIEHAFEDLRDKLDRYLPGFDREGAPYTWPEEQYAAQRLREAELWAQYIVEKRGALQNRRAELGGLR